MSKLTAEELERLVAKNVAHRLNESEIRMLLAAAEECERLLEHKKNSSAIIAGLTVKVSEARSERDRQRAAIERHREAHAPLTQKGAYSLEEQLRTGKYANRELWAVLEKEG